LHWSLGLERRQLKGLARTTIFVCTRVCVGRLLGQERSLTDVGTNIWSAKRLRRAHPDSQEITPPFPHMGCTLAFLRVAWTWPKLHSWKRLHALQMAALEGQKKRDKNGVRKIAAGVLSRGPPRGPRDATQGSHFNVEKAARETTSKLRRACCVYFVLKKPHPAANGNASSLKWPRWVGFCVQGGGFSEVD
jgi:hypothetical protein